MQSYKIIQSDPVYLLSSVPFPTMVISFKNCSTLLQSECQHGYKTQKFHHCKDLLCCPFMTTSPNSVNNQF